MAENSDSDEISFDLNIDLKKIADPYDNGTEQIVDHEQNESSIIYKTENNQDLVCESKINNKAQSIKKNDDKKRDADKSSCGYAFQRLRLIHLIFTEYKDRDDFNNISAKEEEMEDICFTIDKEQYMDNPIDESEHENIDDATEEIEIEYGNINDKYISIKEPIKKILYQEKYGKMTESITITEKGMSGIMKVILDHYSDYTNIEALYFEVSHDINTHIEHYYPRMKLFNKLKEENIESAIKVLLCFTTNTKIYEFNNNVFDKKYTEICNWLLDQSLELLSNDFVVKMTKKINNLATKIKNSEQQKFKKNKEENENDDKKNEEKETLRNNKNKLEYFKKWLKFVNYVKNPGNLENVKQFLQKINIVEGKSYESILSEILERIKNTTDFKRFIKISDKYKVTKNYEDFHTECIYGLLNNKFIDNLFKKNKQIKLSSLFKEIIDKINSCKNSNDMMVLILDAYDNISKNNNGEYDHELKIINVVTDLVIRGNENVSYSAYTIHQLTKNYDLLARIFNCIINRVKHNVLLDKKLMGFACRVHNKKTLFGEKRKFKSLDDLQKSIMKYKKDNKLEYKSNDRNVFRKKILQADKIKSFNKNSVIAKRNKVKKTKQKLSKKVIKKSTEY